MVTFLRPDLGLHKVDEPLTDPLTLGFVFGLDHHAHERLSTRCAKDDPASVAKLLADRLHLLPDAVSGR
jgi:hypothetical protein